MSSAGTVTGKGFVISYSVTTNISTSSVTRGGYTVTIDSTNVATAAAYNNSTSGGNKTSAQTASDKHKFFTSKIALAFTTSTDSYYGYTATGSGSMKYILGS
jgi:hypothetical protein